MSNPLPIAVVIAAAIVCSSSPLHAQDPEPEGLFDGWAEAIADSLAPRWTGPRVDWPSAYPRPTVDGRLRSERYPITVQLGGNVDPELARATLGAAEYAHRWLEAHDWPTPFFDGGYGGTGDFDLYIVDDVQTAPEGPVSWSSFDAPILDAGLDHVAPYAVMDSAMDPSRVDACVTSAYVQASLLGWDPAEAVAWRRATGDYVAWLITGHFGCSDSAIVAQQRESWRTWIGHEPPSGPGGALFLAMLSARTDGLTGDFIRDLWNGAAQNTWEGERLRAAPDMWQVVFTVMEIGNDPLERILEEMGVSRYFSGREARRAAAPLSVLRALPEDAEVPIAATARYDELPRRFEPHGLEVEPYGSAYIEVDTSSAEAGSVLRIWLRGEFGVGWSLNAVRFAEDGTERGRVRAPVRRSNPRSYIPLELTDDETAKVLIVVTNLGHRIVDADEPDDQVRSFRLIVDDGDDEPAPRERVP